MDDNRNVKKVIIVLVILLGISIVALGGSVLWQYIYETKPASVVLPGENLGKTEAETPERPPNFAVAGDAGEREKVSLFREHSEAEAAFELKNMCPSDKAFRGYELSVVYSGKLPVYFRAEADESAKDLMVRICVADEKVYEGKLSAMPKKLSHELSSPEKTTEEVNYDIYAWLPKGEGGPRDISAKLVWWVADEAAGEGALEDSPDTGAPLEMAKIISTAAGAVSVVVLGTLLGVLARRRRRRKI